MTTEYPEHDKLQGIQAKSQAIGEFLEWLQSGEADSDGFERPIFLAHYRLTTEVWSKTEGRYIELPQNEWRVSNRITPVTQNNRRLIAQFFGIDEAKLENEKRAMLTALRKENQS